MLYLRDANLPTTPVYSCSFLMRNMSTIRWSTTSLFLIMLLANSLFSYRQSLSTSSVLVLPEQLVSLSTGWLNLSANIDYRLVRRLKTPVMETLCRSKNFCKSISLVNLDVALWIRLLKRLTFDRQLQKITMRKFVCGMRFYAVKSLMMLAERLYEGLASLLLQDSTDMFLRMRRVWSGQKSSML